MEQGDLNEAWSNLSIAGAAMGTWNTYTYIDGENNTQYAQSGSKRLVPFINKALSAAKKKILPLIFRLLILHSYMELMNQIPQKSQKHSMEVLKP